MNKPRGHIFAKSEISCYAASNLIGEHSNGKFTREILLSVLMEVSIFRSWKKSAKWVPVHTFSVSNCLQILRNIIIIVIYVTQYNEISVSVPSGLFSLMFDRRQKRWVHLCPHRFAVLTCIIGHAGLVAIRNGALMALMALIAKRVSYVAISKKGTNYYLVQSIRSQAVWLNEHECQFASLTRSGVFIHCIYTVAMQIFMFDLIEVSYLWNPITLRWVDTLFMSKHPLHSIVN